MKNNIFDRLLHFSVRFFPAIITVVILLTAVFTFFALRLEIVADIESLILSGENPEGISDKAFLNSDYLIVALEGDTLYTPETMEEVSRFIRRVSSLEHIKAPITPFNQYTFEKNGRQLKIVRFSPAEGVPLTEEDIEVFRKRLLADPVIQGLLVSRDGQVLSFLFPYDPMDDYTAFMHRLTPLVERLEEKVEVYLSGPIPFEQATQDRLIQDFSRLIALSLVVILVLLYLGFRTLRISLLPLLIVIVGTTWTLGLMSIFSIPISIVSIITPPLVLTLGSSYTIHILNQYLRDAGRYKEADIPIASSVISVSRTIVLAALTTIIGFSSLLATQLRQTREFGLATSFGIFSCAILSIFVLPGLLSKLGRPTEKQHNLVTEGRLVRLLDAAGRISRRRRWWFIGSIPVLLLVFSFSLQYIEYDSNYLGYFSKKEKVVQDFHFIADRLSGINQIHITYEASPEDKNKFLEPEVLQAIVEFEDILRADPNISHVLSFPTYIRAMNKTMTGENCVPEGRGLILLLSRYFGVLAQGETADSMIGNMANDDFTRIVGTFRTFDRQDSSFVSEREMEMIIARAQERAAEILPEDIQVTFAGGSLRYKALYERTRRDQLRSTLLALVLIFLATSIFFKSFRYGMLTLLPMITGITSMYIFMTLTRIPLDMTTLMVSCVAIGIGVDDSIHFLLQYRKQRLEPFGKEGPIRRTLHITGRPIFITSTSIVCGILVLTLSSFKPIMYFSLLVSFTLFATTLGCLFILPAILSLKEGKKTPGEAF